MVDARNPRRNAEGRGPGRRTPSGASDRTQNAAITVGTWRRRARVRLTAAGFASPDAEADFLAGHGLGLTRIDLTLHRDRPLTAGERRRLETLLHKRLQHFPLQYLSGDVDFAGIRLLVRAGVFIPRPETEGLVERVLGSIDPQGAAFVVDVGTGTGAIALALAAARPTLTAWGTDVSFTAIRLARRNAQALDLEGRTRFLAGDLTEPVEDAHLPAPVAAVVSNPPYVSLREHALLAPEIRDHEPASALFARENGLAVIRRLVPRAARLLAPGGLLALEIGETQGERVSALLTGAGGWEDVRIERDLAGKDRYAMARRAGD